MVSRASAARRAGRDCGVALAVQLPIASTLVVRVLAAAISAAPGVAWFSDILIKSFCALTCWGDRSANGSVDRAAASALGRANNAVVPMIASARSARQGRAMDA